MNEIRGIQNYVCLGAFERLIRSCLKVMGKQMKLTAYICRKEDSWRIFVSHYVTDCLSHSDIWYVSYFQERFVLLWFWMYHENSHLRQQKQLFHVTH